MTALRRDGGPDIGSAGYPPPPPVILPADLPKVEITLPPSQVTIPDRQSSSWASRPPRVAKMYAVGGPTGGSGKTMISTNLAYLLAATTGGRVVLVDTDLQFGEVNVALQLHGRLTIYDLLYDMDGRPHDDLELDISLRESLVKTDNGIEVLPAPLTPGQADDIGPEEIQRVLRSLRKQCDYIVVDTPTGLRPTTNAAIELADRLVCVTQVDVPGLYNLRSYLDSVSQLRPPGDKRLVVLNKDLPGSGVQTKDATELLGPVDGIVPFAVSVTKALNHGKPVCDDDPRAGVSHDILESLRPLLPEGAKPLARRKRTWWPFGRGRLHA